MLLPALIAGESHPWEQIYSLERSKRHGLGTLLHEALKSNIPFRDWISPAVEKTWDCPVHGSRFDGCGKVIIGPSAHDLPELEK